MRFSSNSTKPPDRPYRRSLSVHQAAILHQERDRQWDPAIVDAFLQAIAGQLHKPTCISSGMPMPSPDAMRVEGAA
jgi:hypothetical protein